MASKDARHRSSVAAAFQAGTSTLTKGSIDPSVSEAIPAVVPSAVIDSTRTPLPQRWLRLVQAPRRTETCAWDGMANRASSDVDSPDRHADAPKPIGFPLYDGNQQRILPINFNRTMRRTKDANRSGAFFRPTRINWPWRRRVTARGPPCPSQEDAGREPTTQGTESRWGAKVIERSCGQWRTPPPTSCPTMQPRRSLSEPRQVSTRGPS